MSRNILDEMFSKEIRRSKSMDIQDDVDKLMGKIPAAIIAKPAKRYTREQKVERAAKIAALRAKRDGTVVDDISGVDGGGFVSEEIVEESEKELKKEDEEYILTQDR